MPLNQPPSYGRASWLAVVGLFSVVIVAIICFQYFDRPAKGPVTNNTPPGIPEDLPPEQTAENRQQRLRLAIAAVASAEDGLYDQALEQWKKLIELSPANDTVLLLNQTVTVLKWIDETNNRLSSGLVSDENREAMDKELDAAYEEANNIINRLANLQLQDSRLILLQAALLEAQARRDVEHSQQLRLQAASLLQKQLETNADPLVACKFDDLVQFLASDHAELKIINADALYRAWRAQPRNLYLLVRASETLLANQDARVVELFQPSLDLVQPMLSQLGPSVARLNPPELLKGVKASIQEENWKATIALRRWLNTIRGASGFRPDSRLVKPDIMALLDVSFLQNYSFADLGTQAPETLPNYKHLDISAVGQTACWFDYDVDLDFDLAVANDHQLSIFRQIQPGEFDLDNPLTVDLPFSVTGMLPIDLHGVDDPARSIAQPNVAQLVTTTPVSNNDAVTEKMDTSESNPVAANRHDTLQKLIVWGEAGLSIVTVKWDDSQQQLIAQESPKAMQELRGINALTAFDIEADGDLDIIVATEDGVQVFQNNGNQTFEDISRYSDLEGIPARVTSLAACDIDQDLDQDVVLVSSSGTRIGLLENILHGQLRFRELFINNGQRLNDAKQLAIADVDCNGSWDILVADDQDVTIFYTSSPTPGSLASRNTTRLPIRSGVVSSGDLNNDGWTDLVAGTEDGITCCLGSAETLFLSSNKADASFSLPNSAGAVSGVQTIDCNRDGNLDILAISQNQIHVWLGSGPMADNKYLQVRVRGINDVNGGGRNNHFAMGTVLEVWSDGKRQRQFVQQPVTHFGLGKHAPENVRIIFTNGLTQNIQNPPVDALVEERQELKGSCPFLYGWNGNRFELITDLLWNAPLGLQIARGQVLPDRRWEHLILPGHSVQARNGRIELRITEELWEVAYFDHVQLTAIDHPADTQVYSNEKVGPAEIAQPEIFVVKEKYHATEARDSKGRDVTAKLQFTDRSFVQPFDRIYCQGLTEPHFVELVFDSLPTDSALRLYVNGWLYPTDTSLNIAIDQNEHIDAPDPPSLWVETTPGNFECVLPFMGFPGGKPKSITVPLPENFPATTRRIRIAGSQQIYWDEIFIAAHAPSQDDQLSSNTLSLENAQLLYRGFSELLPRKVDQPHWYDYDRVSKIAKWPPLAGPFSRYGDVRALLTADDDYQVVMTSGDELQLEFTSSPAPPPGWVRDYVLHSIGWDKDADLNTLAGQGSLPLPYAKQPDYPAWDQFEEQHRVWQLNQPHLNRQ
ncbi:MAG: CRTAC1 family protein [Planctomycetales bacterium]|nr:CRTAC1 family protein [Planctomycetales bacterium]